MTRNWTYATNTERRAVRRSRSETTSKMCFSRKKWIFVSWKKRYQLELMNASQTARVWRTASWGSFEAPLALFFDGFDAVLEDAPDRLLGLGALEEEMDN